MHALTKAAVLIGGALLTLATAAPAEAGPPPRIDLRGARRLRARHRHPGRDGSQGPVPEPHRYRQRLRHLAGRDVRGDHQFVGRYEVAGSSARRLRGTDGWISQILATEGRANVEVFDS